MDFLHHFTWFHFGLICIILCMISCIVVGMKSCYTILKTTNCAKYEDESNDEEHQNNTEDGNGLEKD